MIDLASEYTSTPTANNATYQLYNPFEQRQDIIRIDWQATGNQRVHGRYLHDEYDLLDPYGVFSGAALPTVPTNRSRPGHQLSDRSHVGRPADAGQRGQDQRGVERAADQPAGRHVAAGYLWLSVS